MLRKKLILTNEGLFEMGVEELLPMFDNILKKFSHKCVNSFKKYKNNTYDYDDYYQIGTLELMSAFDKYNHDKGATFFTHLHRELHHRMIMIARELEAEKRKVDQLVYLNEEVDDGCEISNIIGKKDTYFTEKKLETLLKENLTETERLLIAIHFKKSINKSKGIYKNSLDYTIRMMVEDNTLFDESPSFNKAELAEHLGISRPTLNKRIEKAMVKIKKLAEYYVAVEEIAI